MAIAPMGKTLPMMATMVAMNKASICHASGVTPFGTGITNQIIKPTKMAIAAWIGLNGMSNILIKCLYLYIADRFI